MREGVCAFPGGIYVNDSSGFEIAPQNLSRLFLIFFRHASRSVHYSVWSASMGSSEAARRAGATPESTPVAKLIITAKTAQSAGV